MKKFSGKVALVTGSTDGIGFAIARRLAQDGAHVVICSRRKENVDKALQSLKRENLSVSGLQCHVGDPGARKEILNKVIAEHGGLDILVCNAAVNPHTGTILKTSESAYDKIFDVNLKSTFMLIKETVPLMEGRKNPAIVTVASYAGLLAGPRMAGLYAVSKTAIISLTKVLAYELASKNIRINCIAPGLITTRFSETLNERKDIFVELTPLKRPGLPEECSGTASYLCSDDASYITGETIVVSGGLPSRM